MGTIKDLIGLTSDLANRVEDRKTAAEIREIQSLISVVKSENAALQERNFELQTDNKELKETITSLKEQISDLQDHKRRKDDTAPDTRRELSDEAIKILVFIGNNEDSTPLMVCQHTSIEQTRVDYWLEHLENFEMISSAYIRGEQSRYYLMQTGRKYLMDHNLI